MKEKQIQSEFGKRNRRIGAFELKLCKGTSIRWDSVSEHQIESLMKIKHGALYHKLADSPVSKMSDADNSGMRFTRRKPFDCFNLGGVPAYIVVCFYTLRKKKKLYYIDIDDFLDAKLKSDRKSFTEDMAVKMAVLIDDYMKKER